MPDTQTSNYDFVKPEIDGSVDTWGNKLNVNFDSIDAILNDMDPRDAADKPTLVDDDFIPVFDSAAAGTPATKKKLSAFVTSLFGVARVIGGMMTFSNQRTAWSFNGEVQKEHLTVNVRNVRKTGAGSYSWGNTDDGLAAGGNPVTSMRLQDDGTLELLRKGLTTKGFYSSAEGKVGGYEGAAMVVQGSTGNVHYYFKGPSDVVRGIIYTPAAAQGALTFQIGPAGPTYSFNTDGGLTGSAGWALGANGNVSGSLWLTWGAGDAYSAISARIESRAQAWAINYTNSCVQSLRVAGLVAVDMPSAGNAIHNSGYFITMMQKMNSDSYRAQSRMLQMLIPSLGWVQATAW